MVITTVAVGVLSAAEVGSSEGAEPPLWTEAGEATVHFGPIKDEIIERYIASGECFKSAGAFAVENPLLKPSVVKIVGGASAVQGMPLGAVKRLLARALE